MSRCDLCKHWELYQRDDMGVCTVDGGPGDGRGFSTPVISAVLSQHMRDKHKMKMATTGDTYCDKYEGIAR